MAHALRHPHSHRHQHRKQPPQAFIHAPRNIDEASQWVAVILLLFGFGLIGYALFGMDGTPTTRDTMPVSTTYD